MSERFQYMQMDASVFMCSLSRNCVSTPAQQPSDGAHVAPQRPMNGWLNGGSMEQRTYQGTIDSAALAQHLLDTWEQGDTVAQALEGDEGIIVQVGQRSGGFFSDEPHSALTLALEPVSDGLRVTLGEQQWYRDGGGQLMV